jgi:hypothetical protein
MLGGSESGCCSEKRWETGVTLSIRAHADHRMVAPKRKEP